MISDTKILDLASKLRPEFFNPLGSMSNSNFYASCFMYIYREFDNQLNFRMPKSDVIEDVEGFIIDFGEELLKTEKENDAEASSMPPRIKAAYYVKKMCDSGWLEEENSETSISKDISITENGVLLAKFIESLVFPQKEEYSEAVFAIYNDLNFLKKNINTEKELYALCLKPAYQNTRNLSNALKRLLTYIKKEIRQVINDTKSIDDLTANLADYLDGSFIKSYTRLSRENISIYRAGIQKVLEQMFTDNRLLTDLTLQYMIENETDDDEAAKDAITNMLVQMSSFFEQKGIYDQIMVSLKEKIVEHLKMAYSQLQFLKGIGDSEKTGVEELLKYVAMETDTDWTSVVSLDCCQYIDESSLRIPRKTHAITQKEEKPVIILSEEQKDKIREELRKGASDNYDVKHAKAYIDMIMDGKSVISSSEMPISRMEDLLLSLAAFAHSGLMDVNITVNDTYTDFGELRMRDFDIRKKVC